MANLRLLGIGPRLLEPVDLEIAAGELVLLSGPSGSGKSLLLRAVADLDPHDGEARIDGEPRSGMPAFIWRRRVGLLPAESHWWAEQVGDHFPNPAQFEKSQFEAGDVLRRLGFDLDVLRWAVSRLSTGERQRLALARLIANQPECLLLDEATANLDPANRNLAEALVQDFRRERDAAVLWVSHDREQRERLGGRRLIIRGARLEPEP